MSDIEKGMIKIDGLRELEKELKDFPDRIAKNILVGATRAGANIIRGEARSRSSVAEKTLLKWFSGQKIAVQPGFMKKKIASWKSRDKKYAVTVNVGVAGWKDRYTKFFPFYWRFLEFGTAKMAAKPFIRPAFEAKKTEAVERMKTYLAERIDKEASKRG